MMMVPQMPLTSQWTTQTETWAEKRLESSKWIRIQGYKYSFEEEDKKSRLKVMSSPFPWTCCLLQDWLLACNVFLMLLSTLLGHCQLKGEEREGVSRVSDSQTYSFFVQSFRPVLRTPLFNVSPIVTSFFLLLLQEVPGLLSLASCLTYFLWIYCWFLWCNLCVIGFFHVHDSSLFLISILFTIRSSKSSVWFAGFKDSRFSFKDCGVSLVVSFLFTATQCMTFACTIPKMTVRFFTCILCCARFRLPMMKRIKKEM